YQRQAAVFAASRKTDKPDTPRPETNSCHPTYDPPRSPLPTPTGLHHSGSVRPPRLGQRSTCTQRFVQRTPPHTSRIQSLTTHRHITASSQRLPHHGTQPRDLFAPRKGRPPHHSPQRRKRRPRTQPPIHTPQRSDR